MRNLFAGFGYITRNPIIFGAISLDLFAVLLGGALALLPAFARDVYGTGPWGLGLLRAAPAFGALVISVALARAPLAGGVGRIMFACVGVYGVMTIVFALSSSFWLSMAVLAVLGVADMVSVVIRQTLIQVETPDEMRGRVSAVNSLFTGTANQLGDFRAGVMASAVRHRHRGADRRLQHLAGGRDRACGCFQRCCGSTNCTRKQWSEPGSRAIQRKLFTKLIPFRAPASVRGSRTARCGWRGRRPGDRRNARRGVWRPAAPGVRARGWSSGTSWRG